MLDNCMENMLFTDYSSLCVACFLVLPSYNSLPGKRSPVSYLSLPFALWHTHTHTHTHTHWSIGQWGKRGTSVRTGYQPQHFYGYRTNYIGTDENCFGFYPMTVKIKKGRAIINGMSFVLCQSNVGKRFFLHACYRQPKAEEHVMSFWAE